MKNAKLLLSLAGLFSINALCAHDALDIETAIKEGDLETLRILVTVGMTHNGSFAVTEDEKAKFQGIAAAQVEKCKQDHEQAFSKKVISSLDWTSLVAFAALTCSGGIALYDSYAVPGDQNKTKAIYRNIGIGAALYAFGNTLKALKDVVKHSTDYHCKAKESYKKAQQIVRLVNAIPVK